MSRLIELVVDVTQLAGLTDRLGRLSAGGLAAAAAETVNVVTERFDRKQRAGQLADIALDPNYVAQKTRVKSATPGDATATITTSGDLTVMDRYPLVLLPAAGRVDRRGRPFGQRQAGLKVTIKRSAPVAETQWFLMRLKNNNGSGVFVRTSAGKKKHLYGPSPYSLFKHQVEVGTPALLADLQSTGLENLAAAAEKALT